MAFKFPARRHFGFYDVLWLPLLLEASKQLYNLEIRNYFKQFNVNFFQEWRFPLTTPWFIVTWKVEV